MKKTRRSKIKKFQKASGLIKLISLIAVISLILTLAVIAADPARQLADANNAKRNKDIIRILNIIHEYAADHDGLYPPGMPSPASPSRKIAANEANICKALVPQYLPALPIDPLAGDPGADTKCTDQYDTGYTIVVNADDTITVNAPLTQEPLKTIISVTR